MRIERNLVKGIREMTLYSPVPLDGAVSTVCDLLLDRAASIVRAQRRGLSFAANLSKTGS
jgi:hypothetical protein